MPRLTSYGWYMASVAAIALLVVLLRKHGMGSAPAARSINDWDIAELAIYLNRNGIEVRLRTTPKNGPLGRSAYLTTTTKEWNDLSSLIKDPKHMQGWRGTLYCERVGEGKPYIELWGNYCLVVGPFLLYGDPELLDRVRSALASIETS
jgi:hypothetical protein